MFGEMENKQEVFIYWRLHKRNFRSFESKESDVFNIGSEEQVSINEMIGMIEEIADYEVKKNYQLDKPKGVRGDQVTTLSFMKKLNGNQN